MKLIKLGWLLCCFALTACAHIGEQKKLEHLGAKQKLFMKALRWKSYDTAASVIRFKNPARRLAELDGLKKITVTSYELLASSSNLEEGTALAYVVFSYIQDDTGRVYELKHTQNWWFDDDSKQWFLGSEMPMFKLD